MSVDGSDESTLHRRWPRPRFSLLSLLLFVTFVCVALAYFLQPRQCEVEALFQVSARPVTLLGGDSDRFDAHEFEIFQQTQISLIKSYFVLQAAMRDRSIASLPILAGKEDPVAWLAAHVEAVFPHNDEVLAIRLRGAADNSNGMKQLVDAVAKAYEQEVVFKERQERLVLCDALERHVHKLREGIQKKMIDIQEDAKRPGKDDVETSINQIELDILIEHWREAQRELEVKKTNMNGLERIRLIQAAQVLVK